MKKMQKTFWKVINFAVKTITFTAIILLVIFSCAVELETLGLIICGSCVSWLGLIALLAWLEKKFGI